MDKYDWFAIFYSATLIYAVALLVAVIVFLLLLFARLIFRLSNFMRSLP